MLRSDYLNPGSRINLPEVAACLNVQSSEFEILASHSGGMGVCFQLKSLSDLETYALKCIRPDLLGDQDSLERFHEELDVWLSASVCDAVVEAIHIVRINELPCILATWMEGGDLTQTLSTLNPAQKFETIVRITRSLQWAQTKLGIIHRDLKPSNILFDKELLAYLSDWGLSRPLRRAFIVASSGKDIPAIDRKDHTQQGSFLGTVTYAAPEQIRNAAMVDHRADIYALGCVMFELETGSPPFTGTSFQEIAYQHLHVSPPKLGGLFRQTTLGLENVINRCLAKKPGDRYATYEELEQGLLAVAGKQKFALDRCVISERYKRHPLGKGHVSQQQTIANADVKGKGVALVEFDDIAPYLEEAENLIAMGRYKEAEALLRPAYVPGLITGSTTWHFGHTLAATYVYCLQNINDRFHEALEIYSSLNPLQEKPAEFYVNYSLALNRTDKSTDAKKVCEQGLTHFPDDIDLLGNYTISLIECGEIEEAQTIAMRRLAIRRDVHSIEEAAAVLGIQRDRLRNRDLPQAMSLAKEQYSLIKEGLVLNPLFPSLRISEIRFLRFALSGDKILNACQTMRDDQKIHPTYRQLAFLEEVEEISESQHFKTALEMIDKTVNANSFSTNFDTTLQERLFFIKHKIYADRYMIGKDNQSGERILIPEIVDYFLEKEGEKYPYPVMTARVLEWMGHINEAEDLFREAIKTSKDSWNSRKELVLLLQRDGRLKEALSEANLLVESAPWRAESFDVLSYVAEKVGDTKLANHAKKKGNQTFDEEKKLFEKLRTLIS